jgi:hypothetical protein
VDTQISASECLLLAKNEKLKDLKLLNLACNPIGCLGLKNLFSPPTFCGLKSLIMYNCGIKTIKENLKLPQNLDLVNLSYNPGLKGVIPAKKIYLSKCKLKSISEFLETIETRVELLDLSENEGLEVSLPLLKNCKMLETLIAQGCKSYTSPKGEGAIFERLKRLDMSDTFKGIHAD